MRVIVNIHIQDLVQTAGWRAKAVQIEKTNQSCLGEVLNTVVFDNGKTLLETIIVKDRIKPPYILFVNGVQMPGQPDMKLVIKDNVQIHLMKGRK